MLSYKVVSRTNPISKAVKHYGQLLSPLPATLDDIATLISGKCTVTRADVKAVLAALEDEVFAALRNGQSVRLGDLGSFHLTLRSAGVENPTLFNNSDIIGVRVRFIPSSRVRYNVSPANPAVQFRRVDSAAAADPSPGPSSPETSPETPGPEPGSGLETV